MQSVTAQSVTVPTQWVLGVTPLPPKVEIQKSKTERLFVFASSIVVSSFMKIRFELTKP